ncbi:membrane dipeptidase [Vibrio lentus]|nr:membrane dipeptidase [Vibrio lentus]
MVEAFNKARQAGCRAVKHIAGVVGTLWEMGYSNEDLAKLFGGNLMRVYEQTWTPSLKVISPTEMWAFLSSLGSKRLSH